MIIKTKNKTDKQILKEMNEKCGKMLESGNEITCTPLENGDIKIKVGERKNEK